MRINFGVPMRRAIRPESSDLAQNASSRQARLVLLVLFVVSILNFLDRQILSILLGSIKADLRVTDAQLGFLFGTVFAAFYTVFGIPLSLYADIGSRTKLIAWGLGLWSLMTLLSGFAPNFPTLALARMGVGIGEAACSPAAYSLIADLFPRERRGTALGVFSLGIYIGIGLSTYVGGAVVDAWSQNFPPGHEPLGLVGWRAALLVAGIPGLLLVPVVIGLKEPRRDVDPKDGPPGAGRAAFREGLALLPPTSFFFLERDGLSLGPNLKVFLALAIATLGMTLALGDLAQWVCLALGLYVVATLAQRLKVRERGTYALIFETPSIKWATLGFSFLSITGYAMIFSIPEFFIRYHTFSRSDIGGSWGPISAVAGGLGVTLGGFLADRLVSRAPSGRLIVGVMNALLPLPFLIAALLVDDARMALFLFALAQFFAALWLGAGSSMVQDLVLPPMRARASAVFLLFINLVSLALGPYLVGRLSDQWGSLRFALMAVSSANLAAICFFALAAKTVASDHETHKQRALGGGPTDVSS